MNTSGEAADQVVRMSLEVGEAALKISGEGAKQLAVLLYAILKEQKKTKGRARLETLVRSGKPLTVFSVKESDLKKFVQEAKRYGILYCAVRDPKGSSDGMVDIMVKEEDAPRINRIVERFKFASVTEAAQIKTEIQKSREEKAQAKGEKVAPGKEKAKEPPKKKRHREKQRRRNCQQENRSHRRSRRKTGRGSHRKTCLWMNCWEPRFRKRRDSSKTPLRAGLRNPVSPSLSPGSKGKPQRVLLSCTSQPRRKNRPCGRN